MATCRQDSIEDRCILTSNVNATPKISGELKPLYHQFRTGEICLFSATISDDNRAIVPDPGNFVKPMVQPFCHSIFARHARDYLTALTSGRSISLTSYRKPRYIFVGTGKKKILISFVNDLAPTDHRLYFEGTEMSLKGTLKCNLPIVTVKTIQDLEQTLDDLATELEGTCFCIDA